MKRLIIFLITCFPLIGHTQSAYFTKESIPTIGSKVVFKVEFKYDLSKEEFHKRSYSYLNKMLDPYSGQFIIDNNDSTVSRIIDYLDIDDNIIQTFGMYMTYNLKLVYENALCTMVLEDITYMDKQYFETQENAQRKLNMPEYSGKDVMIDKKYSFLLKRKASEKITNASLIRINEIIKNLDASFAQK
jgi:hypothetical protein